jgi:hypothetical protein
LNNKKLKLQILGLKWPMHLKLVPYINFTQWETHHTYLKTCFMGIVHQNMHICLCEYFSIIKITCKFIALMIYYTKDLYQGLHKVMIWKREYEFKIPPTTPSIFERVNW